jgi:anti-sigma regulatory factor (Ser/Thr protein kinase)
MVREPFTIERLARIREIVRWAAAKVGLSLARAERFMLAVSEAVANAIQHGGGRGYLELIHTDRVALTARVIDHGSGMTCRAPVQRPPTSAIHGRGRWLMREYCDHVRYLTGRDGTTVELIMKLPSH